MNMYKQFTALNLETKSIEVLRVVEGDPLENGGFCDSFSESSEKEPIVFNVVSYLDDEIASIASLVIYHSDFPYPPKNIFDFINAETVQRALDDCYPGRNEVLTEIFE